MKKIAGWLAICIILVGAVGASAQEFTVEDIQDAIAEAGASWQAGHNEAWQMHQDYGWYAGSLTEPVLTGSERYFQPLGLATPPTHFDWRDVDGANYVTRVKNQMSCGSCWAFATTGPVEAHIQIQEEWPEMDINLSEQQMVSCCTGPGCNGCDGGFTTTSFDFVQNFGLVDEECFGYRADDEVPCSEKCADGESAVYMIDDWELIGEGSMDAVLPPPEDIIEGLMYGPVGTGLAIYQDLHAYESGVYEHVLGIPTGFHAVTIVGYDIDEEYWICKNSWGNSWGESGYFRIRWGSAFIGAFTILPHYTAQGLKPPVGDDDDAADDDAADDDDTGAPGDDDAADDDDDAPPAGDDDDDNDSGGGCG
jgi:Papain family cysteine protease